MKNAKPHLFIRLVEGLSERAFKAAVTAGPVIGGLAVGMLGAKNEFENETTDQLAVMEYADGTPDPEDREHDQWNFHSGNR